MARCCHSTYCLRFSPLAQIYLGHPPFGGSTSFPRTITNPRPYLILREYHRNVCMTILASAKNDRTNQTLYLLFLFGSTLWHCRKRTIMLINISLCCSDYIITTFNGARRFGIMTNLNPYSTLLRFVPRFR